MAGEAGFGFTSFPASPHLRPIAGDEPWLGILARLGLALHLSQPRPFCTPGRPRTGALAWGYGCVPTPLGKRILEEHENFQKHQIYLEEVVHRVALGIGKSRRTIFYAIRFAEMYPDLAAGDLIEIGVRPGELDSPIDRLPGFA